MRILFVTYGFLPYTFSENICNGKLVLCMKRSGFEVDVISRTYAGPTYSTEWEDPWLVLKPYTYELGYKYGGKITQIVDTIISSIKLRSLPIGGIRWARRATAFALQKHKEKPYDAILTRSPTDIAHLVGREFVKRTNIKWLANWNDPAATIWPAIYAGKYSKLGQHLYNRFLLSCFRRATIHTFPSYELKEHFISCFPELAKRQCEVVPHVCLPDELFPHREYRRGSVMKMCHAGNLSAERDPEIFLRALRNFINQSQASIHLHIIGVTSPYIENLIMKYNLKDFVTCLGSLSYIKTQEKLEDYDVLLLIEAKLEKGIFFPSKLTDYAQAHRPIMAVSPKVGYAERLLRTYGGGIAVNNEDEQDIINGLDQIYTVWKSGKLYETYSTEKLFSCYKEIRVIDTYTKLLQSK